MAEKYTSSMIKSKLGWSNSFNPNAAFPLDFRVWFGSKEEAEAAAATAVDFGSTDSAYHYGMQLYVFDGTTPTTYLINGDNTLIEIGANSDPMLFVADAAEMLALTDIKAGQQVYREDTHTVWIFKGSDASAIDNWVESAAQNDTVWEGTTNKVTFEAITQAAYTALTSKSDNKLYFVTDTGKIYKGATDVTKSISLVTGGAFPGVADAIAGRWYIDDTSLEVRVTMDNATWLTVTPGYITDGANWSQTANEGKLATIKVIKQAIQEAIDTVSITLAYDEAAGKLSVGDQEQTLTNVAHDITWDSSTAKLTIKHFGKEDTVVDIGLEKFVTAGTFHETYTSDDQTYTNVIVLTVENGDPIIIPAEALVNVYTADNTQGKNVAITITGDNKVYAAAIVDPAEGNALVNGENGLLVDLTAVNDAIDGKMGKVDSAVEDNIAAFDGSGSVKDSGYSIQVEGSLTSGTSVPTAALVASAIATAVQAAQGTLQTAIDNLKSTVDGHTASIKDIQDQIAAISSSILGEGNADEVVVSTASGITRSGKTIGTAISDNPSENVIATEKMLADAMSWEPLA